MSLILAAIGMYLVWYSARVTVFNFDEEPTRSSSLKDKQIYWGGAIVLLIGFGLISYAIVLI